ncbi:Hypp1770 [Branchiostoma lanceolatum]|uniref:Hypp1770 protein n=1 Tax=Branchiostoma lanceolatum TaxID=7740 RepID=A0A8J9ZMI1_BRALA|nr:Hypp1770 [Branchiostoma lanceolatum]
MRTKRKYRGQQRKLVELAETPEEDLESSEPASDNSSDSSKAKVQKRKAETTTEDAESPPSSSSKAKMPKQDIELELDCESDSGPESPPVEEDEDTTAEDAPAAPADELIGRTSVKEPETDLAKTIEAAEAYRAAVRAEMQRTRAEGKPEDTDKAIAFQQGYTCLKCMMLFSSMSSLRVHQESCGEVLFRCKLCWEDTDEPTEHMEEHWQRDPPPELRYNPCLTVDDDMPQIKKLYMSPVAPDEEWQCNLCASEFSVRQDNWPTVCSFRNRTRLWTHQAVIHGIVWKKLPCQACGGYLKFHTRSDYLRHMFAMHVQLRKEENAFCCLLCGELNNDRGWLEVHMFHHAKMPAQ